MSNYLIIPLIIGFALSGCGKKEQPAASAYTAEIETWRTDRAARLVDSTGWLNLAGLYWLEKGENSFGSDPGSFIRFPDKAPSNMGSFVVGDTGRVRVHIDPKISVTHEGQAVSSMTLRADVDGNPTILSFKSFRWFIIKRGDRFGVRLRDLESPLVAQFRGIESYPIDEDWRIEATLDPYDPPKSVQIPNILGTIGEETVFGALRFEIDGKTYAIDPLGSEKDEELFVIFGDGTNNTTTYGGGRYLYVKNPGTGGKTFVDFNKAYNPPCAFTAFATCPLPPKQNRLPVAVTAGEKNYESKAH